jgi:hypothetical protein
MLSDNGVGMVNLLRRLPKRFQVKRVHDNALSRAPLCFILREWLALIPGLLARQNIRLVLFQTGKACRLLRLGFGIIAAQQPLKLHEGLTTAALLRELSVAKRNRNQTSAELHGTANHCRPIHTYLSPNLLLLLW